MRRVLYLVALCTAALAFAPAALAQTTQYQYAQQPGPTTITATGVLGPPFTQGQDPEPEFLLTDEATGTTFQLSSGFVDLGAFVGQRVTIEGVLVPGINPLAFNVTSIEQAPLGAVTADTGDGGATSLPSTGGLPIAPIAGAALVALGLAGYAVIRRAS